MTASQAAVHAVLKQYGPLNDQALVPIVQHVVGQKMSSSSIRSRRAELADDARVRQVDSVKMPSGRYAAVWEAI